VGDVAVVVVHTVVPSVVSAEGRRAADDYAAVAVGLLDLQQAVQNGADVPFIRLGTGVGIMPGDVLRPDRPGPSDTPDVAIRRLKEEVVHPSGAVDAAVRTGVQRLLVRLPDPFRLVVLGVDVPLDDVACVAVDVATAGGDQIAIRRPQQLAVEREDRSSRPPPVPRPDHIPGGGIVFGDRPGRSVGRRPLWSARDHGNLPPSLTAYARRVQCAARRFLRALERLLAVERIDSLLRHHTIPGNTVRSIRRGTS